MPNKTLYNVIEIEAAAGSDVPSLENAVQNRLQKAGERILLKLNLPGRGTYFVISNKYSGWSNLPKYVNIICSATMIDLHQQDQAYHQNSIPDIR